MEIFKNIWYVIGLILGVTYIMIVGLEIQELGFNWIYIVPYILATILMLVAVGESNSTFIILLGFNIPSMLITLLIFCIVDAKNTKEKIVKN